MAVEKRECLDTVTVLSYTTIKVNNFRSNLIVEKIERASVFDVMEHKIVTVVTTKLIESGEREFEGLKEGEAVSSKIIQCDI